MCPLVTICCNCITVIICMALNVFVCIPYFCIRPFGIFEVNIGRVRSPSPSRRASNIPYWRGSVEMSVLKNKGTCLKSEVCWAAVSNVIEYISSKHLIPSRYCAGRMVKHSGHQWICPASASENGWLPPLGCPLAATCMQYMIRHNGENARIINRGWNKVFFAQWEGPGWCRCTWAMASAWLPA